MQTLIYKKPIFRFPPHLLPSNLFSSQTHKNHDFLRIHPKKCRYTFKTLSLCSAASPQSLSYGGWDDFQRMGDSVHSGESNQFHNILSSLGIGDKKSVFVYLFGFVCALAISRVKVSSIMVFPACAIVFALGLSVGLVKGGHSKELRLNENRKKLIDDTFSGFIEKWRNLGDNLKGYNAKVLNLKNGIRRSIECNQVTVSDLEGYIDVIESADISFRNTIDVVESCIQSILGGNQEREGVSNHESGRRRKKLGGNGLNFSQYFHGLFKGKFDGPKPGNMEGSGKMELMDVEVNNQKLANILAAPVKERSLNGNLENKSASMLDNPSDNTVRAQNRVKNFVDGTQMENIAVENEKTNVTETNDTAKAVFDQTIRGYQNKTSRHVNNQRVYLKDYQDEIETMSSHNDSYNSVDVSIRMNHIKTSASFGHQQKHETLNRNYSHLENTEEDQQESRRYSYRKETFSPKKRPSVANQEFAHENVFGSSPSSVLGNDLEFNRYLAEANNLLKDAKGCLTQQVDDGRAEHALHKSAILLSKAIDMRPMSLLAVGQLGNTYLLHGELKLKMSRELRSLLVRTDPLPVEEWGKVINRFDDQLANKDKITSALVNVCEESEELLIKAGRKYKLALSIDGNDMRALYNWGLALTFRAQLIADIGPSAACDADKIFLAAIDKFDAMMSKSNVYTPDALFRWGAALQHRSRLRPSHSREKVKLLQQARRLYEDALHMDSGNLPLQEALSSCISELDYWYS
ncbi:hypothetical protein Pfo_012980 [Paulownia fortunei]|nr:hypothetical protein Pfo_012980 [Paulownia fortunei]